METCCIRNDSLNYNKIKHSMKQQQEQLTAYTLAGIFPFITTYCWLDLFFSLLAETRPRKQTYPGFYRIHWREVQSFPT